MEQCWRQQTSIWRTITSVLMTRLLYAICAKACGLSEQIAPRDLSGSNFLRWRCLQHSQRFLYFQGL